MFYFLLLVLSFITHWEWVSSTSILTYSDWIYQDNEVLKEFINFPSVWSPTSLGIINLGISFSPFLFIYSILAHLNVSYGLIERIVFLWPIVIIGPVVSYMFLKRNVNNAVAAFVGSVVYTYNTYFFVIKTGHLTLLMAFIFMPLIVLLYQKIFEERKILYMLLAGVVGFIISFYEFRAFYIIYFLLFSYTIFYVFYQEQIKNLKEIIATFIIAGVPIFIVVLLNLYWLLPFANTGALVSNFAFDRSLFGNEFLDITQAFTLHHPFWTGGRTAEFVLQSIPIYFWIIPIAAFTGLYLNRSKKIFLYFGIISLVGIFFTKQVAQPFSFVYPWMFHNFPGFNAFREASKFFPIIALGYSFLISGLVAWIWREDKKKIIHYGKYFIVFILLSIFLWNIKPIITGEFATMFSPREIPKDYIVVKNYINNQNTFFRTYWIPAPSQWSFYTQKNPSISAVNTINDIWGGFSVIKEDRDQLSEPELIFNMLNTVYADKLLDNASVKYIFIPIQDKKNDDDFFRFYRKDRKFYVNEVEKLPYLKKIDIGTSNIMVYENQDYKPHLYITNEKETIYDNLDFKEIKYNIKSTTEYSFTVSGIQSPIYINFSERYHTDWKIRVGTFSLLQALQGKNYYLDNKLHSQSDAMLNSFYIDPMSVCSQYACKQNNDGSYDISFTVYFKPQIYVYIGSAISIATFMIVLLLVGVKLWHEKKN